MICPAALNGRFNACGNICLPPDMSLVLVRVDDRLIHGQVVGGWLPVVQAERIVVVSDLAAADDLDGAPGAGRRDAAGP